VIYAIILIRSPAVLVKTAQCHLDFDTSTS